jgi:hypothetical protein
LIQGVANELNRRFFDTASATGPFSATAIYGKVPRRPRTIHRNY